MAVQGGGPKGKYPEHPLIAKLCPDPSQPPEPTVRLAGYLGRSNQPDSVRLYPSLDDLSQFIDIKEGDIVHTEAVPESVMENGAVYLWVKSSAELIHGQIQTTKMQAQFLAGGITEAYLQTAPEEATPGAAEPQALTAAGCPGIVTRATCFVSCAVSCVVSCRQTCLLSCAGTCFVSCRATCFVSCRGTCFASCRATCIQTCFGTCFCQTTRICPTLAGCPSGAVCGGPVGGGDPGPLGPQG